MPRPHGGKLVDKVIKNQEKIKEWKKKFKDLPKIRLDEEQIKEVKNIARGIFSPLEGFIGSKDFKDILDRLELADGTIWPIPIILDVDKQKAKELKIGQKIALVDEKDNHPVAILELREKYEYDKKAFASNVFLTLDENHPGVKIVYQLKEVLLAGPIELIDNSKEPFYNYNLDPKETRFLFKERGWKVVVGFQTRNAPHRAHEYLQRVALEMADGLFINPVVGKKKKGDFKDEMIMKTYDLLVRKFFPHSRVVLSILPLKMRYAGPREAVLHAIIRKNFGCTHLVIGRDHAGVGDYYGPYDAQKIFDEIKDIGITILKFDAAFYCQKCGSMATNKTCAHSEKDKIKPSGTLIRNLIQSKKKVPEEIMRREILEILLKNKNPFID